MAVLHVFGNPEHDDGAQKWQFQCDVIIEQPLSAFLHSKLLFIPFCCHVQVVLLLVLN